MGNNSSNAASSAKSSSSDQGESCSIELDHNTLALQLSFYNL